MSLFSLLEESPSSPVGRIYSEVLGRRASSQFDITRSWYPQSLAYDPHIVKVQDTTRIRRDPQNDWPECFLGKAQKVMLLHPYPNNPGIEYLCLAGTVQETN